MSKPSLNGSTWITFNGKCQFHYLNHLPWRLIMTKLFGVFLMFTKTKVISLVVIPFFRSDLQCINKITVSDITTECSTAINKWKKGKLLGKYDSFQKHGSFCNSRQYSKLILVVKISVECELQSKHWSKHHFLLFFYTKGISYKCTLI